MATQSLPETPEKGICALTYDEVNLFHEAYRSLDALHAVLAKTHPNEQEVLHFCSLLTPIWKLFTEVSEAVDAGHHRLHAERKAQEISSRLGGFRQTQGFEHIEEMVEAVWTLAKGCEKDSYLVLGRDHFDQLQELAGSLDDQKLSDLTESIWNRDWEEGGEA